MVLVELKSEGQKRVSAKVLYYTLFYFKIFLGGEVLLPRFYTKMSTWFMFSVEECIAKT